MGQAPQIKDHAPLTLIDKILSHDGALKLSEVSKILSISYKTIFEMASRGRIPAMQIGSNWRIDPVTLAAWVREQQIVTTSAQSSRSREHARRPRATGSASPTQDPSDRSISSPSSGPCPLAAA
jgi:excisionase family DNA binding protein